jgi:hypothetical protein
MREEEDLSTPTLSLREVQFTDRFYPRTSRRLSFLITEIFRGGLSLVIKTIVHKPPTIARCKNAQQAATELASHAVLIFTQRGPNTIEDTTRRISDPRPLIGDHTHQYSLRFSLLIRERELASEYGPWSEAGVS